jgi:hypothetical protein
MRAVLLTFGLLCFCTLSICAKILPNGIALRLESPLLAAPENTWIAYPSTWEDTIKVKGSGADQVITDSDSVTIFVKFDNSISVSQIQEKHFSHCCIFIESNLRQYSFMAQLDRKENAFCAKLDTTQIVTGIYKLHAYLFSLNQEEKNEKSTILWTVSSSLRFSTSVPPSLHDLCSLEESGPNAWKDAAVLLEEITPNDPPKKAPEAKIWASLFSVLIVVLPWWFLFRYWGSFRNVTSFKAMFSRWLLAPISGLLFFGFFTSLLVIIIFNWLYLDIFSTLQALFVCSIATCFFGAVHFHYLVTLSSRTCSKLALK